MRLPSRIVSGPGKTLGEQQQAAAQGDAEACFALGTRYLDGDGVAQDTRKAIDLIEQAAKAGHAKASFRLGKIYHDGTGVPKDYERCLEHYTAAAQAGEMEAQHNIGAMLVSARGVKRDFVEGLGWLILAAHSGDTSGVEAKVRKQLARRPKDIQAGELRGKELIDDLANAAVYAELTGTTLKRRIKIGAPKPTTIAPVTTEVAKPVIGLPTMVAPSPFKMNIPLNLEPVVPVQP